MRTLSYFYLILFLLTCSFSALADESVSESEVLAKRGKGIVTQTTFAARADKIPAHARLGTLRDRKRLQDMLNTLLLRAQLAADAREVGFDKNQIVIDRMKLVAESELAAAWLEHYISSQPDADYEALALEYYQLNKTAFLSAPSIDVSHILVSTEDRSPEEALSIAQSISSQIESRQESFDDLVTKFSEDPSADSNGGKFKKVKKGDMVKPFEDAAFALQEGEVSPPVKTEYGYHIIRLDKHYLERQLEFEEVKANLIDSEKTRHEERVKRDYLSGLTQIDVEMTEESLTEMVRRIFGEEFVQQQDDQAESE